MPSRRPLALPPAIVAIEIYTAEAAALGAPGIMARTAVMAEYIHQAATGIRAIYVVLTESPYDALARAQQVVVSAKVQYSAETSVGRQILLGIGATEVYSPMSYARRDKFAVVPAYSIHAETEYGYVKLAWDVGRVDIREVFSGLELSRAELNPTWVPKLDLQADPSSLAVMPNEPYTVRWAVENRSEVPADFTLTIYDHSGSAVYTVSGSLNPGETAAYEVALSAPHENGIYTVRGCVYNETTKRTDSCADVTIAVGAQ